MADITMCNNQKCPLKSKCYRSTATPNEWRQSYFYPDPIPKISSDSVSIHCDHFWSNDEYQS